MTNPSYWTIQILPEGSGRSQSYRVRKRTMRLVVCGVGGLFGLTSALFVGMLGRSDAVEELERYRLENRALIASLESMERRSGRLNQALDDLSAREQRFRVVAGLPLLDPDVYSVGVGGPGGADPTPQDLYERQPRLAQVAGDVTVELEQLLRRAELLESSMAEAADSVENRREQFQRIPSIWPVASEDSWLSSGFSYNRLHPLLGYRRPHPGVDISANLGTPVVAAGAGRVTFAASRAGYGKMVVIDHGDGYESRYAHLGRVSVRVGQRVSRGEQLGDVGRSGLTTGPNLHYEIRIDDRPVNPYNYFLDDSYRR
ncbi:MAG: M23 family metallopeptidase [Gemmatimonadetes bacterium]|nr:M23 family metallopeptidase [Gemmatimonadota bacterium]